MRSDVQLLDLRRKAKERRIDLSLFSSRQNVQYLSGYCSTFYDKIGLDAARPGVRACDVEVLSTHSKELG